jgi:hypothetical protein
MEEGKKYSLVFVLVFMVIFNSAHSLSLDSKTVITGGGDSEGIVDYLGDEELFFMGEANTAPVILSAILNSTYGTNFTTENLSVYFSGVSDDDGDAVTNITDWRVDGDSIAVLNMPFDSNIYSTETGGIRDYSTYENNGTLGGGNSANAPTWTSSGKISGAYDFDGVNDYIDVNLSLVMSDLEDSFSAVAWVYPNIITTEHNIIWGDEDAYKFRMTYYTNNNMYAYVKKNGESSWSSCSGGNVIPGSWYFLVMTFNGSSTRCYFNGDRVGSVGTNIGSMELLNNMVYIGASRTASGSVNGTIDEVQIFNRSLSAEQIYQMYQDGLAGHSIETFVSNETTKSEIWQVAVTPNDATSDGETILSNELTIENSLPTVTLISPEDENVTTNRTPTFTWTGYDADGDELTYEFNITLIPSSLCTDPDRGDFSSDENYTMPFYLNCLYDNGDYYEWSVRASDDGGSTYGEWSEIWKIYINSDIAISLPVDFVNFGSMIIGTNDTTDDSPEPFLLQNDGNCLVNVTVNATDLWTSVSNPSDYFKYKIDNKTGEEGAFEWLQSQINWAQVPADNEMCIAKLNWSDASDVVEIDLNISVSSQEMAGDKSSTLYFTASLGE